MIFSEQPCCREFQDQVLKLEELANTRSLKIVSLELQMTDKDLSYKKKVSELECALLQAKERVFINFTITKRFYDFML